MPNLYQAAERISVLPRSQGRIGAVEDLLQGSRSSKVNICRIKIKVNRRILETSELTSNGYTAELIGGCNAITITKNAA